jgi:hypothetical protein
MISRRDQTADEDRCFRRPEFLQIHTSRLALVMLIGMRSLGLIQILYLLILSGEEYYSEADDLSRIFDI